MEKKVVVAQYQENIPDDFNNAMDYIEASIDDIVLDTLVQDRGYAALTASKSGPAQVLVLPGRIYVGGKVYAIGTNTTFDFVSKLPIATKLSVLIIAFGQDAVATNVEQRNFLIAAQSTPTAPVYKPQAVATEVDRVLSLQYVISTSESSAPSDPTVSASVIPIARVILNPTGVESVTMLTANEVANLEDIGDRVVALEAFRASAEPEISALSSDLARLSNENANPVNAQLTGRILARLATLEAKDGIPSNATDSSADFFLDTSSSDLTNPLFVAKVEEGIRFADDNANDSILAMFNPNDPSATVRNNVLFPAFTRKLRQSIGPNTGSIRVSVYTYQTTAIVQKTMARTRVRYGTPFTVCTNSAYWATGTYNAITGIFTLPDGETFNVAYTGQSYNGQTAHEYVRLTEFWTDTVNDVYWDAVTVGNNLTGAQVAETFPVAQDTWLESVGIYFTQLDASGDASLVLCECGTTGLPDLTQTLAQATISRSSLVVGENIFALQPTYLQAGKRYAVVVIASGDHYIASTDGTAFPQGTFFTLTAGAYAQGDLTRHIGMNLYACSFTSPRVQIAMQPLQLSGGMTSIDILAALIAPASTTLTYEIQIPGTGVWEALSADTVGMLNSGGNIPPLIPLRVTMQGSTDIMPCINLSQSNVHVSRPRTSYVHIGPPGPYRTLPAASSSIRIIERYEAFDPTYHATTCSLLSGTNMATVTPPSSFTDVVNDDGSIERTYVFNLASPISTYQIKSSGTTTTALKTFHTAWRKDYAL